MAAATRLETVGQSSASSGFHEQTLYRWARLGLVLCRRVGPTDRGLRLVLDQDGQPIPTEKARELSERSKRLKAERNR